MVSFFGLKLGGDKKKKSLPEVIPAKTRALDLDEPLPTPTSPLQGPRTSKIWSLSPSSRRGSFARPGTSHSFRSVSAPRPMFMNGTATASLQDLQSFEGFPRPKRDSLRESPMGSDRLSMRPAAAVGGTFPRVRAGSKATSIGGDSMASPRTRTDVILPKRQESMPTMQNRGHALESLFSADTEADEEPETIPEVSPMVIPKLDPIVPPASLEAALITESPRTPMLHSPLAYSSSPLIGHVASSSPKTYSPGTMHSPYSPSIPSPNRQKMPPNSAFKPYSPGATLPTKTVALESSPISDAIQPTPITTSAPIKADAPPVLDTSFSISTSIDTSAISIPTPSPMIPESPFSQFNFEFDFGTNTSTSTDGSTAPSSVTTGVPGEDQSLCSPALERTENVPLSRTSTSSPSPSLPLTINTNIDTGLSPRGSASNTSGRSIPSPSQSIRSNRSIERPSFDRQPTTKPSAPSGLRVVRNAIPSIGPDAGLNLANSIQSPSSVMLTGNLGARSPTPDDEKFVLQGDEVLALQWEGPPVIKEFAAKRNTMTLESPHRQSFSFDLDTDEEKSPVIIPQRFDSLPGVTKPVTDSPQRPRTSAGPSTNTPRFGGMANFTRSCSTDGNRRLSALRPATLALGAGSGVPNGMATAAGRLQFPAMPSPRPSISEFDLTRSQSPLLNIAMRSPTFGRPGQDREEDAVFTPAAMASPINPSSNSIYTESIASLNSPLWQPNPLTTSARSNTEGPYVPPRNPGRAGPANVIRASTWEPACQITPVAGTIGLVEPQSAIVQTAEVLWPLMSEESSPPTSPAPATATVAITAASPPSQIITDRAIETSPSRVGRDTSGQRTPTPRDHSVPRGRVGAPAGPSSVRDRVRNLEVREASADRSRSRSRDQSTPRKIGMSPMNAGGFARGVSPMASRSREGSTKGGRELI